MKFICKCDNYQEMVSYLFNLFFTLFNFFSLELEKKARTFDFMAMFEQAKQGASERNKKGIFHFIHLKLSYSYSM